MLINSGTALAGSVSIPQLCMSSWLSLGVELIQDYLRCSFRQTLNLFSVFSSTGRQSTVLPHTGSLTFFASDESQDLRIPDAIFSQKLLTTCSFPVRVVLNVLIKSVLHQCGIFFRLQTAACNCAHPVPLHTFSGM